MKNNNRFAFGKNWKRFIRKLNPNRIAHAENSLKDYLFPLDIKGKSFLDAGCGSGLFSLAARNLGASVFSFDFDKNSVLCTRFLKNKFHKETPEWKIIQGDILNNDFLNSIGRFDIVYSWGVLHHTGDLWQALENISRLVSENGTLFISLYNDQGLYSRIWKKIKKKYVSSNKSIRFFMIVFFYIFFKLRSSIIILFKKIFFKDFLYKKHEDVRGMDWIIDLIDWIGGYPFEVSKPEEVFNFFYSKGFSLTKIRTCRGGHGCNEFVFRKGSQK
jgi:2-polyprenyl-6-hydroxyphenyl methylase/3-demethylubiquinone-9 3-methyltransferase